MNTNMIKWTDGVLDDFKIPFMPSVKEAKNYILEHKKEFVWNILSNFEDIAASLSETSDILEGKEINHVQYGDLIKIKEYAKGVDFLATMIEHNVFEPTKHILCCLHSCIASKEISESQLGKFRKWDVRLSKVKYRPPQPRFLDEIWNESLRFNDIKNPLERALVIFLSLSRTQFFYDNNKRTAMLYTNGLMISSSVRPFYIPANKTSEFISSLKNFYETGLADEILLRLANFAVRMDDNDDDDSSQINYATDNFEPGM